LKEKLATHQLAYIPIMNLNVALSVDDFTIILNALHYYKKAEKRGNFKQYTNERINQLRDDLADQFMSGFD
jgi:hypothetical protein